MKHFILLPQKSYWIETNTRKEAVVQALKEYVVLVRKVEGIDDNLKLSDY